MSRRNIIMKTQKNKPKPQNTQTNDTTSRLLDLPQELRDLICRFSMADAKVFTTATSKRDRPLFQVSEQVRADAQDAYDREAELIIFVGSNFADRAWRRQHPGHEFDLCHVDELGHTSGLIDIDQCASSAFRARHSDTLFRHVRFQVYNEGSIESTRQISQELSRSDAAHSIEMGHRRQESLVLSHLSISWAQGRLHCESRPGESHPDVYKPPLRMRPTPQLPYDACDIQAALESVISRAQQIASGEDFKGFTTNDVEAIAHRFRYLTPRGRFQDAIYEVIAIQEQVAERKRARLRGSS